MKKLFLPCAVITSLFLFSCGDSEPSSSAEESTQKEKAKLVGEAETETTTVNGVEIKIIPGLSAVDVYLSMEKIGFQTEKNIRANIASWRSKMSDESGNFVVDVTGGGPEKLTSVDARYSTFSDPDMLRAAQFMQYVSTVPYKGANPDAAKMWVGSHADEGGDTLINGVKFRITAYDKMHRSLYISVPD
jgi:hypothetical protein